MAIKLDTKPNTEAPSTDYPFGSIRDTAGLTLGTPVSRLVYTDFHQFFERLMQLGGVAHNGLPDNATNGYQLNQALQKIIDAKSVKYFYDNFGDVSLNFTAITGGFSRWNLTSPNGIYEMDFVNNTLDTAITTFGMSLGTEIGSVSYFKFNQNPNGTEYFRFVLNSSNLDGGNPIIKKGVSAADQVYDILPNQTFILIRWEDSWELIDFNNASEWKSITGAGTDFSAQPAFALVDSDGFVRMKGQSIFEDEPAAGTKVIGTLPVGCRPTETIYFNCICYPVNSSDLVRRGQILTNGDIVLVGISTSTLSVELNQIPQFRVY